MGRQVTIIHGGPVALPNGATYPSGATVTLTDAQWGLIRPEAVGTIVQDDGAVDFGEANYLGDNYDVDTDGATEGAVLAFLPGDVWGPSTEAGGGGGGATAASELSDYAELARLDAEQALTNKTITDFSNFVAADEQHVQVYNDSGVLLGAGTPVYLTGYHFIGTAAPTVAKADATSAATMPCIGLTNEVIGNGNYGEVVVSGFINSVNTSAFSNGDTLYVSETAGELTATPPFPDGINQKQPVAVVLYAAGGGKLQVLGYGVETAASETEVGVVELATAAEVDAGTDDVRAISPASLAGSALQTAVDALGATLHTDAAADPNDVNGATGDFHLRRDTGVLTGPKVTTQTTVSTNDGVATAGGLGFTNGRVAIKFDVAVETSILEMKFYAPGSAGSDVFDAAYILDDSLNIIHTSDESGVMAVSGSGVDEVDFTFTGVTLPVGTYYAAIRSDDNFGPGVAASAERDFVPNAFVVQPTPERTLKWSDNNTVFTDPDDGDYAESLMKVDFVLDETATWTGADTRILGDVVQADLPTGATLHTSPAADPVDGTGEVGDFHLRRDTGVLTGPKIVEGVEHLLDDGKQNSADLAHRVAIRFTLDSDASIESVKVNAFDFDAADPTLTGYILDASRNILGTSAAQQVTEGQYAVFDFAFPSPVALAAGEYYLAIGGDARVGLDLGNGTEFSGAGVSVPAGGAETLIWNSTGADFSDAPDETEASVYFWSGIGIANETWTGADTRVLGDVVQADIAGFVSSGVVHTDAAADSVDGTGAVGDFHLRRDTSKLTGPKVVVEEVERSSQTRTGSAGSSGFSQALRFRCVSDFTVTTVDGYLGDIDGSPATVKFHILDASRNIIGSTAPFELTSADDWTGIRQDLLSPVDLAAGYEYWIAYEADELVGSENSGGASWPDAALAPPSGGESLVRWTSATSDFTSTPDDSYVGNYWRVDLVNSQGSTWTGADELLIASRLLDVEDEAGATYDVVADDTGKVKRFTAECIIDLVDGLPVGTVIELMAFHANGITVQDNGTSTVHGGGTVAQYGTCSALCVATDTWVVTGAA